MRFYINASLDSQFSYLKKNTELNALNKLQCGAVFVLLVLLQGRVK
jgi:hypothetical protein